QAQLKILAEHGIERSQLAEILFQGDTHDEVIDAILSGRADAGFVRSGVIEALAAEGRLAPDALKVINPQDLASYPYAVSTRLYPESAVLASAHLPPELARRVAAALMMLESDHPAARAAGIAGFSPATDY
ncbi:PhnD/SsuA/transferrin family substrate-binding protein, partial [Arthrospira platensis SPKY1]|nr:PhnD/SsuA/transferrin family substrate-binding protein [Arthrospira platensis SPKY1]